MSASEWWWRLIGVQHILYNEEDVHGAHELVSRLLAPGLCVAS
jgi:hypothetical protein